MATESASSIYQPGNEPQRQLSEAGLLEVMVEQPGGTCNQYEADRARGGLRLEHIISVEPARPADLARSPLTSPRSALDRFSEQMQGARFAVDDQSPSLPVLLLSRAAVAPGVWVTARLIGALRLGSLHTSWREEWSQGWTLLAVPQVDHEQEALQHVAQLAPERRAALVAFLRSHAPDENQRVPSIDAKDIEWMEAEEAARLLRQIRSVWRQRQRQQSSEAQRGAGPREHLRLGKRPAEEPQPQGAWRALAGVTIQQLREQGLGAYAEAEHLLRLVPQRFQHYLGELLLDNERVLYFIERSRLRRRRGLLGLGARYLNEGLLLCTDRQVLWLRDVATPDATLVPWGYVARSCPVERLAEIHLLEAGQASQALKLEAAPWARLILQSAAAQATIPLTIEFPTSAHAALQQAVTLLKRFLPFPTGSLQALADRRVRRLPSVSIWEPRAEERELLLQLGGMTPQAARERLQAALAERLCPGEEVLAQTISPVPAGHAGGPRLLAVTPERLLFGQLEETGHARQPPHPSLKTVPLAEVAAVQLRHSLLGCVFEVAVPAADGQVTRHSVPFNSPAIVPFRAIYTRTRLLIASPYYGQSVPSQTPSGSCASEGAPA